MRWKIRVATHQKWLKRDARVGTLAKEVNLFILKCAHTVDIAEWRRLHWCNRITSIIRTSGDRCSFYMSEDNKNYAETLEKATEPGDTRKTDSMVRHT